MHSHASIHHNVLQHIATFTETYVCLQDDAFTCVHTLQRTATDCNTLQHSLHHIFLHETTRERIHMRLYTATCCNTLQHSLQHIFVYEMTHSHVFMRYNTLQRTATQCNTHSNTLWSTRRHFHMCLYTATHCNAL